MKMNTTIEDVMTEVHVKAWSIGDGDEAMDAYPIMLMRMVKQAAADMPEDKLEGFIDSCMKIVHDYKG